MKETKISSRVYDTNPFITQMKDDVRYKQLIKNLDKLDKFYNKICEEECNRPITTSEYNEIYDIVSGISNQQYPVKYKKNDAVRNSSIQYNLFNNIVAIRSISNQIRDILISNWVSLGTDTIYEILMKYKHDKVSIEELLNSHFVVYKDEKLNIVDLDMLKEYIEDIVNKIVQVHTTKSLMNKYHDVYHIVDRDKLLKDIISRISLLEDDQLLELKKNL